MTVQYRESVNSPKHCLILVEYTGGATSDLPRVLATCPTTPLSSHHVYAYLSKVMHFYFLSCTPSVVFSSLVSLSPTVSYGLAEVG